MIALLETSPESLMPWPLAVLLLGAGVVALLFGGHLLVEGAITVARKLGMSTLLIGLTIVAFGTSAPELALNAVAAAGGQTGLAFGNIIGSNIANIGLVLGLTALIAPITVAPALFRISGFPWLIVVTLVVSVLPLVGSEAAFARWAGIILLGLTPVTAWLWYRQHQRYPEDSPVDVPTELPDRSLGLAGLLMLTGLALLIGGGKCTEIGAVSVARWLGLSEAVIGLSIVAVATSLPEVITSIMAARRGQPDLALGTVVGSNLFNLALVLGVTATISPVAIPAGGWLDLTVMTGLTILLVVLAGTGRRLGRTEGVLILTIWVATLVFGFLR